MVWLASPDITNPNLHSSGLQSTLMIYFYKTFWVDVSEGTLLSNGR